MAVLFHNLPIDQANSYGLVLASSEIPYEITEGKDGWELRVQDANAEKALNTIQQYVEENKEHVLANRLTEATLRRNWSGIWVSLALLGLHIVFRSIFMVDGLFQTYGASAFHILDGELYRTVTSLMLHNGTGHLAGNMVGIALFGTAVCTVTGVGIGWLMILSSGAGGNLVNAFFYHSDHLSVGASTAVFGAVGILCAEQFFRRFTGGQEQKIKAWIPLAGGLALLGLLGTGVRADLMAHLFGFLVGLVLGIVDAGVEKWASARYQVVSLVVASGIVILAWLRPLMGS
jgi:membrane associated rhomboid family serine protease